MAWAMKAGRDVYYCFIASLAMNFAGFAFSLRVNVNVHPHFKSQCVVTNAEVAS